MDIIIDRDNNEIINQENEELKEIDYIKLIFDSFQSIALIVNDKDQIVYVNKYILEIFNTISEKDILGLRVGELFGCINMNKSIYGCGTGMECRYCDIVKTIRESQIKKIQVSNETRLTITKDEKLLSLDLKVSATPFEKLGRQHLIIIIEDISDKKRRLALEELFFHDVLNTAGNINGIIKYILEKKESKENIELFDVLDFSSNKLLGQINAQKDLVLAEKKELELKIEKLNSIKLIKELLIAYKSSLEYNMYIINLEDEAVSVDFFSDHTLLYRVLENLIKNAIEASEKQDEIKISIFIENEKLVFKINNKALISEKIKTYIFQRSFSTKGKNRGLGTYGVKLITEDYLNGEVSFDSLKNEGTNFYIKMPL